MPNIKVKSISDAASYWVNGAQNRASRYVSNAPAAGGTWQANTVAAKANYKSAISAADIDSRFAGGVNKAGAAGYANGINLKGKDRYSPGVQAGQSNYTKGEGPMLDVIAGIDRGTRGVRGTPSNYDIVRKIGDALHAKRLASKVA